MNELSLHVGEDRVWPPPFKVITHRLAKSVKLRASNIHGLIITVPKRFNLKEIPTILEMYKPWILKHIITAQTKINILPTKIFLQTLNQNWSVYYEPCTSKFQMIIRPCYEIVLCGKMHDQAYCIDQLIAWLKQQAINHLIPLLLETSNKLNMPYNKVMIRDQKTRWGSCTSNKTISLNYKLLLLPLELCTHVLIHELCHTKYLNHSDIFWKLVAQHDPLWKEHRSALRKADNILPIWTRN